MSSDKDNASDKMQEAMSRNIPKDGSRSADDAMTDAMTENRQGAEANPVDGDPQTKAMSNEFEVDKAKADATNDQMQEAMTETRKSVKKDK